MSKNPYVGPRTFEEKDAEVFFGREREARELLSLVISEPLVLFYAQSGAGKSSLINTRLTPSLREEGFAVLPLGRVGGTLPEGIDEVDNIFVFNLLLSIDQQQQEASELTHTTLSEYLQAQIIYDEDEEYDEPSNSGRGSPSTSSGTGGSAVGAGAGDDTDHSPSPSIGSPSTLRQTQGTASSGTGGGSAVRAGDDDDDDDDDEEDAGLVLIIDQFEEILTTNLEHWQEREAFFQQLREALEDDPFLWVVLSMREDHVGALAPYARLLPGKLRARFHMPRMKAAAAKQAIEKPAAQGGRPFGRRVAKALVDNLRQLHTQEGQTHLGEFVEPVQLQVVCYQLWENLKNRPVAEITQQDVEELGDVDTALAQFYEQAIGNVLANCGDSELSLRNWFERELITEAHTRGTVYRGAEKTAGLDNQAVDSLANQFLLRSERRAGGIWYELVHDRFIDPILQANQAWRLQQSPLIRATEAWEHSGRSRDKLYTKRQLMNLPADLNREALEPLVQEFLQASEEDVAQAQAIAEAEAKAARRLRRLAITLIVMCVLAVGASITIWRAQVEAEREREEAQRQSLISLSQSLSARAESVVERTDNTELAALLAVQAHRVNQDVNGHVSQLNDISLRHVLTNHYFRMVRSNHDQWIWSLALSANKPENGGGLSLLAAGSQDGVIRVWDMINPSDSAIELLGHDKPVLSLAFSPDGQTLASGSSDQTIRLWDARHPNNKESILEGHTSSIWSVAFTPDGRQLASASSDGTIRLWDLSTSAADVSVLRGHDGSVLAVAFAPDGQRLASAGDDGTIRLWDLSKADDQRPTILRADEGWVLSIAFAPDGETLASAGSDGTIRLWDINNLSAEPTIQGQHDSWALSVAFTPDGRRLVSTSADQSLKMWNLSDEPFDPHLPPDMLALIYEEVDNRQEDIPFASPVEPLEDDEQTLLYDYEAWVWSVAFNSDGKWLASGSGDGMIHLWNFDTPKGQPTILKAHEKKVLSMAISPQSNSREQLLATTGADGLTLWSNISSPERSQCQVDLRQTPYHQEAGPLSVVFSPDPGQQRLALVSERAELGTRLGLANLNRSIGFALGFDS